MRVSRPLFLALACVLAPAFSGACFQDQGVLTISSSEARVSVQLSPFRYWIEDGEGAKVLESAGARDEVYRSVNATFEAQEYRPQVLDGWFTYNGQAEGYGGGINASVVSQTPSTLTLDIPGVGGSVRFTLRVDGPKITLETEAQGARDGQPWNKVSLAFDLPASEHFFGMGERFASLDHRGLDLYSWAEEGALGKGENTPAGPTNPGPNGPSMTYFPVPFFLSSRGYAAYLDTTFRSSMHFGSERPDAFRMEALSNKLRAVVYVHKKPLDSIDDFSRDTGRPFVPPPWAFGLKRRMNIESVIDGKPEWRVMRERNIPITTMDDARHFLPHRSELGMEDQLRELATSLHQWGYKLTGYYNPYVSLTRDGAKGDRDFGIANGLFLKNEKGEPGSALLGSAGLQSVATIDLTNPRAVDWFQELLGRAIALGYDGWMHDFGEYVKPGWTAQDGRTGAELHNAFPVLSAKAAHDLVTRVRPNDFLFYVRSGYIGTAQYVPAVWGGDPEATFDETQGLPAALRSGLNLGMTGVPMWGSDVSGYKCLTDFPNDKEVYLRWVEMGAVSPFMIEQDACSNPTGAAKTKWNLFGDAETTEVYRQMAGLHTRMQPYFQTLAAEAHATGAPIMRHPFLLFPNEPESLRVDDELFLGPSLLAAPVVRRGLRARKVWFPPGRYVDLDTNKAFTGPSEATIDAPLAKLPLFLVQGSMLPLLDPSIQTLGAATEPSVVTPATVADRLDVIVALAPSQSASFTLPDGTTLTAQRTIATEEDALTRVEGDAVSACEGCWTAAPSGDVERIRVTTARTAQSAVRIHGLKLTVKGVVDRRIRWDVRAMM